MTFKHIALSYIQWVWGQWGRLSALFVTIGVIVSLTVGMARATRRYDALADRVQAAFGRRQAARSHALNVDAEADADAIGRRERAELIRRLDEILARLPASADPPPTARGPLISSQ